VTAADHN